MAEDPNDAMATLSQALEMSEDELDALYNNPTCTLLLGKFAIALRGQEDIRKSIREELELTLAEKTRLATDTEQQFHELQHRMIQYGSKLESEAEQKQNLNEQLETTNVQLEAARDKVHTLDKLLDEARSDQASLQHACQQAELDKRQVAQIAERRSVEIERLNAEWKVMSERLAAATTARLEAQSQMEETQSTSLAWQVREKRLEQEKEILSSQITWLNEEVQSKSEEILSLRREKSTQSLDLKSQLNDQTDQISTLNTAVETLKLTLDEREKKIESYMTQLEEIRTEKLQSEEHYQRELTYQTRLTELQQERADESQKKLDELVDGARNLQQLLAEGSAARVAAEDELQARQTAYEEKVSQLEDKVSSLERELERANDLLTVARQRGHAPLSTDQIANMAPQAATTSARLQSGMTLTQIYSLYVEATDDLQNQKDENDRLVLRLNQIVQELREKQPLMQEMQREYEDTLKINERLSTKLENSLLECEKFHEEADEAVRDANHLKRENHRLENNNMDLSRQVRILVKEVEEARGGLSSTSFANSSQAALGEVSSSDEVITSRLVTFRNIEELQEQNRNLLAVVRDLSEKLEQEERQASSAELQSVRQELEMAVTEMEDLREHRTRQMAMVDALVRQRDMYRVLAQSSAPKAAASIAAQLRTSHTADLLATPGAEAGGDFLDDSTSTAKDLDVNTLQTAMDELRHEFKEYQEQKAKNIEVLTSQVDQYREEAACARTENARLVSKLEYAVERQELLTSNTDGYRRELEAIRQKNNQLNVTLTKLQMKLDSVEQECSSTKDRLRRAEHSGERLRSESQLMKSTNVQLQKENESLLREQRNQVALLASLQTIQNNVERSDFEMRKRLTHQLEVAQDELIALRRRFDADAEHHRTTLAAYESEMKELRSELVEQRKSAAAVQGEMAALRNQLASEQQKVSESAARAAAAEVQLSSLASTRERVRQASLGDGPAVSETDELRVKLSDAEANLKSLESQLERAKQHVDQFKSMSDASESALADMNKAHDEYRQAMDEKLAASEEQRATIEQQLCTLQQEHECLVVECTGTEHTYQEQMLLLREDIGKTTTELAEALQSKSTAEHEAEQARQDLASQMTKAAECQDRYERELVLHAATMQEASTAREQLRELAEKFQDSNNAITQLEEQAALVHSNFEKELNVRQEAVQRAEERTCDLAQQVELLHQQVDKLSSQVITLQSADQSAASGSLTSSATDDERSAKDLREIIRFVRREKEIAETKLELAHSECSRLSQRCEHQERQLQSVRQSLEEERERAQRHADTAAHHAEIMDKLQTFNIIQDSNKLLRDDRDRFQRRTQQLEAKCQQLEEDITPLRESNRSLAVAKDSLVAEKTALKTEVARWSQRCQNLIEQCNKVDEEELKELRVLNETKDKQVQEFRSQLEQSSRDKSLLQEKIRQSEVLVERLQSEIQSAKQSTANALMDKEKEVQSLKLDVRRKMTQLANTQRRLGDLEKQMGTLRAELQQKQKEMQELQQAKLESEEYRTKLDDLKKMVLPKIKQADAVKKVAEQRKQELDRVTKELEQLKEKRGGEESDEASGLRIEALQSQWKAKEIRLMNEKKELEEQIASEKKLRIDLKKTLDQMKAAKGESKQMMNDLLKKCTSKQERISELEMELLRQRRVLTTTTSGETSAPSALAAPQPDVPVPGTAVSTAVSAAIPSVTPTQLGRTEKPTATPTASIRPISISPAGPPTAAVAPTPVSQSIATVLPTSALQASSVSGPLPSTRAPSSSIVQQAESTTVDQPSHVAMATSQPASQDSGSSSSHDAQVARVSLQPPATAHVSSAVVMPVAEEPSSSAVGTAFPVQSQGMSSVSGEPSFSRSSLQSSDHIAATQQSTVSSGQQPAVTSSAFGRVSRVTKRQHEPEEASSSMETQPQPDGSSQPKRRRPVTEMEEATNVHTAGEVVAASSSNSQQDFKFAVSGTGPAEQVTTEVEAEPLADGWDPMQEEESPEPCPAISPDVSSQQATVPEVIQIDDSTSGEEEADDTEEEESYEDSEEDCTEMEYEEEYDEGEDGEEDKEEVEEEEGALESGEEELVEGGLEDDVEPASGNVPDEERGSSSATPEEGTVEDLSAERDSARNSPVISTDFQPPVSTQAASSQSVASVQQAVNVQPIGRLQGVRQHLRPLQVPRRQPVSIFSPSGPVASGGEMMFAAEQDSTVPHTPVLAQRPDAFMADQVLQSPRRQQTYLFAGTAPDSSSSDNILSSLHMPAGMHMDSTQLALGGGMDSTSLLRMDAVEAEQELVPGGREEGEVVDEVEESGITGEEQFGDEGRDDEPSVVQEPDMGTYEEDSVMTSAADPSLATVDSPLQLLTEGQNEFDLEAMPTLPLDEREEVSSSIVHDATKSSASQGQLEGLGEGGDAPDSVVIVEEPQPSQHLSMQSESAAANAPRPAGEPGRARVLLRRQIRTDVGRGGGRGQALLRRLQRNPRGISISTQLPSSNN